MERKLILSVEANANYVTHMIHVAQRSKSAYHQQYRSLHDPKSLKLLERSLEWMRIPRERNLIRKEVYLLLVRDACACEGAVTDYYQQLLDTGIESLPEIARQPVTEIVQAMLSEYDAYMTRVWPIEQPKLCALAGQLYERLDEMQVESKAEAIMKCELLPVTELLQACDMGSVSWIGVGDGKHIIHAPAIEDYIPHLCWDIIETQMNAAIQCDFIKEAEMNAWMGAALHYHWLLTGIPYWMKHYKNEIDLCEKLEADGPLGIEKLFTRLKARSS